MFEQRSSLRLAAAIEPLGGTAREAFVQLRRAEVQGVLWPTTVRGLRPRDLDRGARHDLEVVLRRLELELAAVELPIPPEHYALPEKVDRAVSAAGEAIRFAAEFGRVPVCMRLPDLGSGAAEVDREASQDAIAAIVATADRFGVILSDERVPIADRSSFGEVVGVGLDPVALLAGGIDPAAAALEHGRRLASARLADLDAAGVRLPPGEGGRLDLMRYRVALELASWEGFVLIDPRQWRDPRSGVIGTVAAWREAGAPVEP